MKNLIFILLFSLNIFADCSEVEASDEIRRYISQTDALSELEGVISEIEYAASAMFTKETDELTGTVFYFKDNFIDNRSGNGRECYTAYLAYSCISKTVGHEIKENGLELKDCYQID